MSWQICRLEALVTASNMFSWLHWLKLNFYGNKCFSDNCFFLEFAVREYIALGQMSRDSDSASEALQFCKSGC